MTSATAPRSTSSATRSLPFALAFIVPTLTALAIFGSAHSRLWLLLPPAFLFVVTPLMDFVLGKEQRDFAADNADAWRDLRYDIWLWLWAPLQIAIQIAALFVAATTTDLVSLVGITFASGLLGGIGINVAHEMMHRKGKAERALAEVLMTTVGYTHFCVEHVLGHHKSVATHDDPASARRGESIIAFLPRSIIGSVVSYWKLERARVQKLGITRFSLRDRRMRYPLMFVVIAAVVAFTLGPVALAVFLGQCAVAALLLETINYLEHYGLSRRELAPGVFERVEAAHSWSASEKLTSYYLFLLPRHADHHAHASRPYFALRHLDEGPQLPAGYATMLLIALVPPLWRKIMDPRVDAWHAARVSSMSCSSSEAPRSSQPSPSV